MATATTFRADVRDRSVAAKVNASRKTTTMRLDDIVAALEETAKGKGPAAQKARRALAAMKAGNA